MSIIPVQEIKRRGMGAVDDALKNGPVHLIKNNRAEYVVMAEKDYQQLMNDLMEARLAASEQDLKSGRISRGTAADLMNKILEDE
jgi:PHD/YefM family antitoxin component YafN of YafNO toxin-antitoxin module